MVGGTTYNITFGADVIDHTFDQNTAGEIGAASQIKTALNATNAAFVSWSGAGVINQFVVGNILTGGEEVTSFSSAKNWHDNGFVNRDRSASIFTAVPNPVVVLASSQVVSAVDGLVVDGVTYNVTFSANGIDHTFDNNPNAEGVAAAELQNALNGTGAAFVQVTGAGSINQFVVGDILFGGLEVESGFVAGNWQNAGFVTRDSSAAIFTPVPPVTGRPQIAEPGSLPVLAIGLAGFVMVRWDRPRFNIFGGRVRGPGNGERVGISLA